MSELSTPIGPVTTVETKTAQAAANGKPAPRPKPAARKSAPKPKKSAAKGRSQDGTAVGFKAKSKSDCKWTPLKVEFYRAIKKCGGEGTSERIAKASGGKINAGHARHFGYHGMGGGLIKVETREDVHGFVFVLTAKGYKINPAEELAKQKKS